MEHMIPRTEIEAKAREDIARMTEEAPELSELTENTKNALVDFYVLGYLAGYDGALRSMADSLVLE